MTKYTIDQFIKLTKQNPDNWKGYCEILIDNDGSVILARPSHQEALIQYYCDKKNITREEMMKLFPIEYSPSNLIIDKYNLISVWYMCIIYSYNNMNNDQRNTLDILADNHLILPSDEIDQYPTREYRIYLEREDKNEI